MTYYLKYRPQTLEEIDQETVRKSVKNILQSDNVPHAFLFSGPRGTGKTSAARIVAKILNCEKLGKDLEPCNSCSQCKAISRGESLDVIELDAASHRGIDDVRQIREAVKLSPIQASKKVYIIDEAHMLTTEASNALLKTLEEPPAHVVFILATTNPEKLIETIRSRVSNIFFKKAKPTEIVRSLKRIAVGEKIKIDDSTLDAIAQKADGSFRDAVKTLEQAVSELDTLSEKNVGEYLTNSSVFNVDDFLTSMSKRATKETLMLINQTVEKGLSSKELIKLIIGKLREKLLASVGVEGKSSADFTNSELIVLIELFTEASSRLLYSYIEEVPLEIAVIKWCEKKKEVVNEEKSKSSRKFVGYGTQKETDNAKTKVENIEFKVESGETENLKTGNGDGDWKSVDASLWQKVLTSIGPDHASTEALLKASHPLGINGNKLKLGVYYKFHKEHLESNFHRRVLEETLSMVTGSVLRVVCELTDPPKRSLPAVVLTEPKDTAVPAGVLTNQNSEDIINLAEKIFSN